MLLALNVILPNILNLAISNMSLKEIVPTVRIGKIYTT